MAETNKESDGDFLARIGTDGAKWAAEFRRIALDLGYSDMDEGWLTGWFANAIEAGADRSRNSPDTSDDGEFERWASAEPRHDYLCATRQEGNADAPCSCTKSGLTPTPDADPRPGSAPQAPSSS